MIPKPWQKWLRQILNPTRQGHASERRHFRPRLELLEDRQLLSVFLVDNINNGGAGSLRAAILAANINPGPDTIDFDIEPGGAQTISLTSPLPTLADTLLIDGTSQPGWIANPLITIDGTNTAIACNGLTTTADGCKVKGLLLQNFRMGAAIGLYSSNNVITGSSLTSSTFGVEIANAVAGNIIGGTTVRGRNVISGNNTGVSIHEQSTGNLVQGNYIGTDAGGGASVGNGMGVDIEEGAASNIIGGTAVGAGNLISGNAHSGVAIEADASGNQVQGNKIGTDALGESAVPNMAFGVDIFGTHNTVGGIPAGTGNLISGNTGAGIMIEFNALGSNLEGNKIGTNATGTSAVPNNTGVAIFASNTNVGGTIAGASNLISGNKTAGVFIYISVVGSHVQGNSIGTNADGTVALGNSLGVDIEGDGNTVGGAPAGAGNLISGNTVQGVLIKSSAFDNVLQANMIGTNRAGTATVGNSIGVEIDGATNTVGDPDPANGNLISGNTSAGVLIAAAANGNQVQGNRIGTNAAGKAAVSNLTGVDIFGSDNSVSANVIAGNTSAGIRIEANASGNQVQENFIGTDFNVSNALANDTGVDIYGSNNTVGGTTAKALNVISGNTTVGVQIEANASGNQVQGNKIGTNAAVTARLPNDIGVEISGINNTVGGTIPGAGNVISGNKSTGVFMFGSASGNQLQGNSIGSNTTGTAPLANGTGVQIFGSNNTVGGTAAGAGNIIAFNGDGVDISQGVGHTANGNAIRQNSIFGNSTGGIFLLQGGNNNQHAPTLTTATFNANNHILTIKGTLNSTANTTFTLEFFANPTFTSQGKIYLGSATVVTNFLGAVSFTAPIAVTAKAFSSVTTPIITATATDPNGNTSAFSNGVHDPVEPTPKPFSSAVSQFSTGIHDPVKPPPAPRRRLLLARRRG